MASVMQSLSLTLFFALLFSPNPTFSAEIPESSPSPYPQLPPPPQLSPQAISPPPTSPAPSPAFPDSPPAPPPSILAPDSPSPAPAPAPSPAEDDGDYKKTPSPAPIAAADYGEADQSHLDDSDRRDDSGGMSGGKKAGIAIGVIAAGCVVGLAAMVYRKRQHNIRRMQYSYTDRRDFL